MGSSLSPSEMNIHSVVSLTRQAARLLCLSEAAVCMSLLMRDKLKSSGDIQSIICFEEIELFDRRTALFCSTRLFSGQTDC